MNAVNISLIYRLAKHKQLFCYRDEHGKPRKPDLERRLLRDPLIAERIKGVVSVDNLPLKPPALNPGSRWKTVSLAEMELHIGIHLRPDSLFTDGVPIFDMGVLQHMGFAQAEFLRLVYSHLRLMHPANPADRIAYLTALVKTLLYAQELGFGEIDWSRVEPHLPNAKSVTFDINKDSQDGTFFIYIAIV
ncbi:hypothetical protein HYT84_02170 [Candidatus Micrarchaeota archaeon]|nr:hypothetical protein [Candidatus Micrarchaeota archaeon]